MISTNECKPLPESFYINHQRQRLLRALKALIKQKKRPVTQVTSVRTQPHQEQAVGTTIPKYPPIGKPAPGKSKKVIPIPKEVVKKMAPKRTWGRDQKDAPSTVTTSTVTTSLVTAGGQHERSKP